MKLQDWRPATLLKIYSNAGAFLWNLQNLRTPFFAEHLRWLLLISVPQIMNVDSKKGFRDNKIWRKCNFNKICRKCTEAVAHRCSVKKVFLKNSQNSQENTCVRDFLNKVTSLWPATLFKKRLSHRSFPVNFAKFLRRPFFTEHLWWLLLNVTSKEFEPS